MTSEAVHAKRRRMSREDLLRILEQKSDVKLAFTAADGSVELVPGHSMMLQLWSKVMATALETAETSLKDGPGVITIPMEGTNKEDWLLAMEFVYPVAPAPIVTWDNLQLLLQLGDKYCMPALQSRVGEFLVHNKASLDLVADSPKFAWKWIYTADRFGLTDVAKICIQAQNNQELMKHCPIVDWQHEQKLSVDTLQYLLQLAKSTIARAASESQGRCQNCRRYY